MSEEIELYHSFDAKLATNIGEQSVSSQIQAVLELIKNSYDADATECKVHFYAKTHRGENIELEKIVVEDNGIGMSFNDLKGKWMRVATSNKEKTAYSPIFERRVSGEKGMGHFASQRLGNVVKIISEPEDYQGRGKTDYLENRLELVLNWNKYIPGKDFEKIPNKLKIQDRDNLETHGVWIGITELKDIWTLGDIDAVMINAGTLIAPEFIRRQQENPFEIKIIPHGFEPRRTEVESVVEKYAPWEIRAQLRGSLIHFQIFHREKNDDERKAAGNYGKKKAQDKMSAGSKTCGNAEIVMYIFENSVGKWAPNIVLKRSELGAQLEENCGVKIFKDGIRVMPYGRPGDDWVGLDNRWMKRAGGKVRNRNVIGYVSLKKERNPEIIETATREALKENYEFRYLRDRFVLGVLAEFEEYRIAKNETESLEKAKQKPSAKAASEIIQLRDFVESLNLTQEQRTTAVSKLKEIGGFVEKQETETRKRVEEVTSNLEMYRNLASLGISALAFHHELLQPIGRIRDAQKILKKYWKNWDDLMKLEYVDKTLQDTRTIIDLNSYIREFASLFKGAKGTKKKREEIDFKESIDKFNRGFHDMLDEFGIVVDTVIIGTYLKDLYVNRASWESILMNLLSNSIKALSNVKRDKKKITITFEKTPSHLKISVFDNGEGISENDLDRVFDPLWTTSRGTDTIGTGMGTTIVKEIVTQDYKGEVSVKSKEEKKYPGKGETTMMISIPLAELKEKTNG